MGKVYDAIIVGARCAGSPTAMLLARKGYRVLVVDRATFPSDTVSTHVVQPLARGRPRAMGAARPAGGDRMPADPHLHLRLRSLHDLRRAGHEGCSGRVLPAADRARQAARRRRRRGRRRDSRGLHRRRGRDRRRRRRRHQGPFEGRRHGHRARQGRHRRGWPAFPRGGGRPARTVQREAAAAGRLLHLLERSPDATGGSKPTSARTADSRRRRRTTV